MKFKPATLLILAIFFSNFSYTQYKIESLKETKKSAINWTKYEKSKDILIEYSFQEDNPSRGYKGEYIVFRITNSSYINKSISWDFSAVYENGKCLNCNNENAELHFDAEIPPKSFISGNVNNYYKGPLAIFYRFTDDNYKSNSLTWKSFNLNNLNLK